MSTRQSASGEKPIGKGSLDGLAQRLGALEESLTVVAGELGVSAVPQFKRLDPDAVYREAIRRAQESVEPLRTALRKLETAFGDLVQTQSEIERDLAAATAQFAGQEKIAALDDRMAALSARLDATVLPFDRSDAQLVALHQQIERLSLRLDTLWERLDADARKAQEAASREKPETMLAQRLTELERRLEKIAGASPAGSSAPSAAAETALNEKFAGLQASLFLQMEKRLAQQPAAARIDESAIAEEISRQLAALMREAAQSSSVAPLPSEPQAERPAEINPLVISATERAIVRLTHRLERLEEWRRAKSGEGKTKSGLMGRLFES